jgi:hypothetical protein
MTLSFTLLATVSVPIHTNQYQVAKKRRFLVAAGFSLRLKGWQAYTIV